MSTPRPRDLLERAEKTLYCHGDFETSSKFYERAIESVAKCNFSIWLSDTTKFKSSKESLFLMEIAEKYGVACLNANEIEKAKAIFSRIVECSDFASVESCLSLAQLHHGQEALNLFKSCLLRIPDPSKNAAQCSSIYCSIAELYLSDLCFEPDAANLCFDALTKASSLTPHSYEVSQLLCSYFISCKDLAKAKESILLTVSSLEKDNVGYTIPFEFKVQTARLLMELGEHGKAIEVLVKLIDEDDEIVETWLLLSEAYFNVGEKGAGKQSSVYCQKLLERFMEVDPKNQIFLEQQQRLLRLVECSKSETKDKTIDPSKSK